MKANQKRLLVLATAMSVTLLSTANIIQAAPRGTPTIVTNDASSPVLVSGEVTVTSVSSNLYKPVGVTVAKVSCLKSNYALSAACATEFPASRICSSEELINKPKTLTIGANAAFVMPTTIEISGVAQKAYSYNVNPGGIGTGTDYVTPYHLFIKQDDFTTNVVCGDSTGGYSFSVACCAQ
jgi:hypothetical protein